MTREISEIYGILIPKVHSYQMHDFHISCFWMGIPCKPNTGSTYCSSSTAYPCNLCLCCNTIFHCCTHICVSSGIVLKLVHTIGNGISITSNWIKWNGIISKSMIILPFPPPFPFPSPFPFPFPLSPPLPFMRMSEQVTKCSCLLPGQSTKSIQRPWFPVFQST